MKNTINDIFEILRNYLLIHEDNRSKILSLYVNTDTKNPENHRERPAWQIEISNQIAQLREEHGDEDVERVEPGLTWKDVEERLVDKISDLKKSGRSVVVFTDLTDDIVIELPIPVETSAYFGLPQVKHLLSQLHRYGKYLVILFSESEHRVISVDIPMEVGEVIIDSKIESGLFLRPGGKKSRTQASERRDLDSERRVIRQAANEINKYFMSVPEFDRIVFGGNLKLAHQIKSSLHHSVVEKLVSIEPIPFDATQEQIEKTITLLANEHEELQDNNLVLELLIRRDTCGRGVVGTTQTLTALNNGQVRKLLMPYPMPSGPLDDILVEALMSNVEIELIHGKAAETLNGLGGVGALMYYTIV
jgi:hypothetical protein